MKFLKKDHRSKQYHNFILIIVNSNWKIWSASWFESLTLAKCLSCLIFHLVVSAKSQLNIKMHNQITSYDFTMHKLSITYVITTSSDFDETYKDNKRSKCTVLQSQTKLLERKKNSTWKWILLYIAYFMRLAPTINLSFRMKSSLEIFFDCKSMTWSISNILLFKT